MELPDLPPRVREVLLAFVETTKTVFGDALVSVVLYGSAAEGRMRQTSDVNVLLVVREFRRDAADALREPIRVAFAAIQLRLMVLSPSELPLAMEAFAQKFADMQNRRVVLFGTDPFAGMSISRFALIQRVRQVLLNQLLRLRVAYLERSLRSEQAVLALADAAGPLRVAASTILDLEGRGSVPPKEALITLTRESGREDLVGVLDRISEAREGRLGGVSAPADALFHLLALTQLLHERAGSLE